MNLKPDNYHGSLSAATPKGRGCFIKHDEHKTRTGPAQSGINKYSLPCVGRLSHIKFDLNKLRQALIPFAHRFQSIHSANEGLCENHTQLADFVKDHFFQVSLTECRKSEKAFKNPSVADSPDRVGLEKKESATRSQKYRKAVCRRRDFPQRDERNWNIPIKEFQKSYFYECVNQFKSPAIRVRLTTLQPGKTIAPHIDYNVSYAVRIVVPVYTNDRCQNYFWRRGEKIKIHIPADGHPYFLNVALKHSVENLGKNHRTVFMFSLKDTADIRHLIQKGNRKILAGPV